MTYMDSSQTSGSNLGALMKMAGVGQQPGAPGLKDPSTDPNSTPPTDSPGALDQAMNLFKSFLGLGMAKPGVASVSPPSASGPMPSFAANDPVTNKGGGLQQDPSQTNGSNGKAALSLCA